MKSKTKEQLNIRRMCQNDIDSVLDFNKSMKGDQDILSASDMVDVNPGGPMDFSIVAEINGNIVGFIIARLSYSYLPAREVCLINGIVVNPSYRRQHIASRLVNELLNCCHEEEIPTVRGLVHDKNEELKRVVENLGFHRSVIINFDKTFES
jgi:N-acetylglutamate synthase-like GNAT family acetyltransferase